MRFFTLPLLLLSQSVFGSVLPESAPQQPHLVPRRDGYPGLDQIQEASARIGTALKSLANFNGELEIAQTFFQQAYEAVQLLDEATKELEEQPPINFFTALSYNPVSNRFLSQASTLSKNLVNKKKVLIQAGWGENTFQLLDAVYRSGSTLLRTYFSKRGGLVEWAAGGFENQINNIVGNAREQFRTASNVIVSTVIVYAPAPTAPPAQSNGNRGSPYAAPPQFQNNPWGSDPTIRG